MAVDEQMEWESRWAKPAAAAALGCAAASLASFIYQGAAIGRADDGQRGLLTLIDQNHSEFLVAQVLQSVAYLLLGGALLYLLRAVLARRSEVPRIVLPIVCLAPALLLVGGALTLTELFRVADVFTGEGDLTEKRADDLLGDASPIGSALGLAGSFCLAVSFVLVALNAMRVGLLSRFMGVLGMVVGGMIVLLSGIPEVQLVVQAFWLGALGLLFLNRWPGGRGPAWETGEAIEWPSAAGKRDLEGPPIAGSVSSSDPRDPVPAAENHDEQQQPLSRKRKRKRR